MMILKTSRSNLSSNDQLSLDLPFAATKSLAARVGPTPTFTRGSGATYIGSDGLIHGVDTSTTSNSISAASKTFTLAATAGQDQLWRAGDAVEASNGVNIMAGTVTSYDPATQSLVCNMTTVSGGGTFTSWRIGYRGPRFDHTSAGVCRGLLIEEGRTNLFSSTNINSWGLIRCTRTAITGIGLTNQAATLTISETGSSRIQQVFATLTTGVAYAISIRVKAGTLPSFVIADFVDSKFSRAFNLSTNQWAASGGSADFTNYTVTPNIDGWFLVSVIYTPTGATGAKNIVFDLQGVVGDTVSFDTPQLEAGAFPTSFIPTTTGTLARSADVCNITGGDFNNFYNQSEGTMFAESLKTTGPALNSHICGTSNGSFAEFIDLRYLSDTLIQNVTNHLNVTQFATNRAYTLNAITRQAIAYALNDAAYCAQGGVVTVDVPPYTPPVVNRFQIGTAGSEVFRLNGCVRAIRYYRKRLPNAKLVTLTT